MKKGDAFFIVLLLLLLALLIYTLLPRNEPDHCNDKIKNFDEEAIDCGGSCISCKDKFPGLYHTPTRKNVVPLVSIAVIFSITLWGIIMLRQQKANPVSVIKDLIQEAHKSIENDLVYASSLYRKIKVHYSSMPKDDKMEVYLEALKLYEKIEAKKQQESKKHL